MAAIVNTPHDALVKISLKDIAIATDFLKAHLPKHIQKRIDFTTLKPTDGEFVSSKFSKIQSDIVYSCKIDGVDGYVYILIEHQSGPHPLMAFRKLQYEVALMDAHLKAGHSTLPVTIPLCLYHGDKSPYPYSNDVYDCFDNPELAREVSLRPFKLVDLTIMDDEQLQSHGIAALFEMLIKHHGDKQIHRLIKKAINEGVLQLAINSANSDNYLQSVLDYIGITGDDRQQSINIVLDQLTQALPHNKGDIMTWAEQLATSRKAEFVQEGEQHKQYEIAMNMLREGDSIDKVCRVTGLDDATVIQLNKKLHP